MNVNETLTRSLARTCVAVQFPAHDASRAAKSYAALLLLGVARRLLVEASPQHTDAGYLIERARTAIKATRTRIGH